MKPWRLISFHTNDDFYTGHAAELVKTIQDFPDIAYVVYSTRSRGNWWKNTELKAHVIAKALKEFPNDNIVFVDADARIRQYPELFDTLDCDVAARVRNRELLSGTLYFRNTRDVNMLVDAWLYHAHDTTNSFLEQKALHLQITAMPEIHFKELPAEYTALFDKPKEVGTPVIEHMQASRDIRRRNRKCLV